jgi:hypothetical protein
LFKVIDTLKAITFIKVNLFIILDIPIIGTTNGGYYLNAVRLRFSLSGKEVHLNPE